MAKQENHAQRQCMHCGKFIPARATQCVYCKESLPELNPVRMTGGGASPGGSRIRRGLLFMLMAAVVQYFGGGFSGYTLPVGIDPTVLQYLVGGLFVLGLGFLGYGFYLKSKG